MKAGQVTTIIMKVRGGEEPPPSVLAPKIGPLGMSPRKLGLDIAEATKNWKGWGIRYVSLCIHTLI